MMVRWLIVASIFSSTAFAKDKLVASPVNSPVKETFLKVKLEGFDSISGVLFKPKNGSTEVAGEVVKEGTSYIGKLKASALKPGSYEYRVKVQTLSGISAKDEAASTAFINFVVDSSLEVSDPGEECKKTLAGIDSDNDGVRDDIQRWINENFSSRESFKQGLKQYAKYKQLEILNVDNKAKSIEYTHKTFEATECNLSIAGYDETIKVNKELIAKYYNTEARVKATNKADSNFHGQGESKKVLALKVNERIKLCEFEATKEVGVE